MFISVLYSLHKAFYLREFSFNLGVLLHYALGSKCSEENLERKPPLYLLALRRGADDNIHVMNQMCLLKIGYVLLPLMEKFTSLYFVRADSIVP